MRPLHPALLVSALLFASCAADEPEFLTAPQGAGSAQRASETTVPVTEPDTGTLALAHNVPAMSGVEPVADASGNLGSGCTNLAPANGPLGDGLWAGAIDDRTPAAMVLDLVCMTAAGPQNTSEAVRINPAADDLQVFDASGSALDAGPWRSEPPDDRLYWIAVNGGVVTSAEQMG